MDSSFPMPPDRVPQSRTSAVHFYDTEAVVEGPLGRCKGSILCNHPVSYQKQYTKDKQAVTCDACVFILMNAGHTIRGFTKPKSHMEESRE